MRSTWLNGSARGAEKELLAQLKEMARLAEDGAIVFEPPAGRVAPPAGPDPEPAGLVEGGGVAALPGSETARLPAPAREVSGPPAVAGGANGRGGIVDTADIPETALPMDAGAFATLLLTREAAYVCAVCGRGAIHFTESCPGCGTFGALLAVDGTALLPVPEIREIFDEILENRAFVRRLVARAARGDEAAARRLTSAGPRAVRGIFREMLRVADPTPLIRILTAMGPGAVPAILRGFHRAHSFSTKKLVRHGVRAFRSLDGAVVLALAGMGETVLPELEPLLDGDDRAERLIVLDVLIRLGCAERLEAAGPTLSLKELLERLNACPPEDLGPLLDACAGDGYLATAVLTDRTFTADSALVAALGREGNRRKIREILIRRGFSAGAYDALEGIWGDSAARLMVRDVVRSFGRAAADHLLKTYTSPLLPEEVREDALGLFLDLGDEEVERLVDRLSEGDTETEKAVLRGVKAFGSRAVPALVRAYGKSGILQKVGLNRRRSVYRRMTILRALAQIGTYDAMQGLRQIHDREGDPELRRRIQSILERLSGRGGGS